MRVAVPTEVMNHEYRVAITPAGVHELVARGHEIIVQAGAGLGSAITDEEYRAAGARIEPTAEATWASGELVLKVKEPVGDESNFLHDGLVLFTYLHLAADRPLTEQLLASGTTALGYETVQLSSGMLPLLLPMSEVAGCLAPQLGAYSLMKPHGGRGLLLGGVAGVKNPRVVVLGAGVAGQNAINVALGMGADVTVLDNDLEKLRLIFWRYENRVQGIASNTLTIREEVAGADMVIGAVLVPGFRTPKLVTNEMVAQMKQGSVLVTTARGSIHDEAALVAAIQSGRIAAAGLDVFHNEPNIDPVFATFPNVVLSPHQASGTVETRKAMGALMLRNLEAHFDGRPLPTPVG